MFSVCRTHSFDPSKTMGLRIFHVILILGLFANLNAQKFPPTELAQRNIAIGLMGHYGEFYTDNTYLAGMEVTHRFHENLEAGLFVMAFASPNTTELMPEARHTFGGFGGFSLQPNLPLGNNVTVGVPLAVGFGSIGYSEQTFGELKEDAEVADWDPFFMTSMGLSLNLAVSRNSAITLMANYRRSGILNLIPDRPEQIQGFTLGLGFKTFIFKL